MTGLALLVAGLALGALVLGALALRAGSVGPRGRLATFAATVGGAFLAAEGSIAIGGDIRVLPIVALVGLALAAVRVTLVSYRDGASVAIHGALVLALVAALAFVNRAEIQAALEGDPDATEAAP